MAEDPRTLHIHQRFTYRVTFTWQDEDGNPVPLAGYEAKFWILSKVGTLPALIELESPVGVVVEPGGATGQVAVTLTAAQTETLPVRGAYAIGVNPVGNSEPLDYVASGPFVALKLGA